MTKNEKRIFAAAVEACRLVVTQAEETGNCGCCGEEFDNHQDGCPYPKAKEVTDELDPEVRK